MTTPFDELQAYCGPHGPGCRPHQPDCAVRTHGLPVWNCDCGQPVLDTEHPLFQALWELEGCSRHMRSISDPYCDCEGVRYAPRSRAEAALRLWYAARTWIVSHSWVLGTGNNGKWAIYQYGGAGASLTKVGVDQATPEDALAAAVLAALKVQEGVKS